MDIAVLIVFAILAAVAIIIAKGNRRLRAEAATRFAALSPDEQAAHLSAVAAKKKALAEKNASDSRNSRDAYLHGNVNAAMVCPHCSARGSIRTKEVINKRGVSGGKATAAVLTGGISLLATGLSRKEQGTEAWCGSCKNTWTF